MEELVEKIALCIERGKVNRMAPYPPDMNGQDGADEIARAAVKAGVSPDIILKGSMAGMQRIGEKFSRNEAFIPELLMSAKAMNAVMEHLKPFFQAGKVKHKGTFIIGTVAGDLHDIGKKLVGMVVEGNGWDVVDLGVDVSTEKFMQAIKEHPGCTVGMSALLTTTMVNMDKSIKAIKDIYPDIKVLVGGAPLTREYADKINADGYARDPQGAVRLLERAVV
ncbi:cobalamin-binding protein [candidate division KSB1 bacterium RBG_16_48_16]|nr:MAG: cobalamin-binding protein [candidate division KSB1 bacterium RBG_16_48_16]